MEIVVCLFAVVGLTYLIRDGILWLVYRKPKIGLWLAVPLKDFDRAAFCDLMRRYHDVSATFQGKSLLAGVRLVGGGEGGLSRREAEEIARIFCVPVKKRRRSRIPPSFADA